MVHICLLQSADLIVGRHVQIIDYLLSYQSFCIKGRFIHLDTESVNSLY